MMIRTATLGLAAIALIGCDGMKDNRNADAAEKRVDVAPPAARVANIELGRNADESLRVTEPMDEFGPRDTLFLSVVTSNAQENTRLTARWSFQDGSVVDSSGQNVAHNTGTMGTMGGTDRTGTMDRTGTDRTGTMDRTGTDDRMGMGTTDRTNTVTQFRIARDEGWMVGNYTVDVWMNDNLVGTKTFTVKQ